MLIIDTPSRLFDKSLLIITVLTVNYQHAEIHIFYQFKTCKKKIVLLPTQRQIAKKTVKTFANKII